MSCLGRCCPVDSAAGELADALEPGEQGLAGKRYRGGIDGELRHDAKD
jgi:hypothetical protein